MKNKKQIVLEEGARLFREKGYLASTMRDLADRVGLKQASSLYNHYKKEEILQQICFDNANKFINGMNIIEQENNTAREKIKELIALHIRIANEDSSSVMVFNDEWRHLSEPFLTQFLNSRKAYEERFKQIIIAGIANGEFKNLDPNITMYTMLNAIKWIHYGQYSERGGDQKKLQLVIENILLNGIGA